MVWVLQNVMLPTLHFTAVVTKPVVISARITYLKMLKFFFVGLAVALIQVKGQSEICPPGSEYWPHPDCTKYYHCNSGIPQESSCPTGLYWNVRHNVCDFPREVPECVGGTREPIAPTSPGPEPTTTPPTTQPPTTTEPDVTTPAATEAPTTAAPTSAAPTTAAPTTAPPTKESPVTEQTIPDSTTRVTTEPPPGQCPAEGVLKIAHEELCDAYYWCVNGERLEPFSVCPGLYLFDIIVAECLPPDNVDCGDRVGPSTSSQNPSSSASSAGPSTTTPFPTECPDSGTHRLPYPGNCTLYSLCIDGSFSGLYRCPEGTLFDTQARTCRSLDVVVCTVEPELSLPLVEAVVLEDVVMEAVVLEEDDAKGRWSYFVEKMGIKFE